MLTKLYGPGQAPKKLYLLAARETGVSFYSDIPITMSPSANLVLKNCHALS